MQASLVVLVASGASASVGCVADTPAIPGGDSGLFDQFVPQPLIDAAPARDSGAPDASRADATALDSGAPDSDLPDASAADSSMEDAAAPDTGAPDADAADASVPDTGAPDGGVPDTGVLDAGAPDTGAPDTGAPDSGAPDTGVPDASAPDAGPTFTHFLYTGISTASAMEGWGIDLTSGALTPVNETPDAGASYTLPTGRNPLASCVAGPYLYTANASDGSVSGFTISHGLLARIDADPATPGDQDFPAGTTARFIVATKAFVFTANQGTDSVSEFSIGAGGFLTSLGDVALAAGSQPDGVAVDPTGSFLFTFNYGLRTVSVFTIDAKGALARVDQDPKTAGVQDFGAALAPAFTGAFTGVVHPTLPAVYMAPASGTKLSAVSYDATGVLSLLGAPQTTGSGGNTNPLTYGVAVDPTGSYLYAVSYEDTAINIYALDAATGAPTAAGTGAGPLSAELRGVTVDPAGSFLFVGGDNGAVAAYAITPQTGALTAILPTVAGGVGHYTLPIAISP